MVQDQDVVVEAGEIPNTQTDQSNFGAWAFAEIAKFLHRNKMKLSLHTKQITRHNRTNINPGHREGERKLEEE